eukprot:153292-Amphidinium_carterae.1
MPSVRPVCANCISATCQAWFMSELTPFCTKLWKYTITFAAQAHKGSRSGVSLNNMRVASGALPAAP